MNSYELLAFSNVYFHICSANDKLNQWKRDSKIVFLAFSHKKHKISLGSL